MAVEVTVKNTGIQDINNEIAISLTDQKKDSLIETYNIDNGLTQNDSLSISYTLITKNFTVGEHIIIASHNYEDDNTENNSLLSNLEILPPDIIDLSITSLTVPDVVTEGESIEIEVSVKNIGNQDINEAIEVTLEDETDEKIIDIKPINNGLISNDSTKLAFVWNTSGGSIGDHTLTASLNFNDENATNDLLSRTVAVTKAPVPDIAISTLDADPETGIQGEEITVSVTVENVGNLEVSRDIQLILTDLEEDKQLTQKTINGLGVGNRIVIVYDWYTNQASIGEHTLEANHNFDDENTENNSRTITITIFEPPVTDLAVTNVNSRSRAFQGEEFAVSVDVQNQGNQDIDQVITVTLDDQQDGITIGTKTIESGLAAGQSATLEFLWNTDKSSLGNHTLTASHNISDDNADNNSSSTNILISEPPFFDIAVTNIDAPERVRRGNKANIKVTLENKGNRDVNDAFSVTLIHDEEGDDDKSNIIGTEEISGGLEKGTSIILNFEWDTSDSPWGTQTLIFTHDFNDNNPDNDSDSTEVNVTFF